MRISVDPTDEAYSLEAFTASVRLDGVERHDVITADEERGHVVCLAIGEDGHMIVDKETGEALTLTKTGIVKVVLPCEFFDQGNLI